jgi:hypothetical protein
MSGDQSINPWSYKPWWCQPWSILLTGNGLIAASWGWGHRLWLTVLVALPVMIWMFFFLLLWPRLVRQAWAELEAGEEKSDE